MDLQGAVASARGMHVFRFPGTRVLTSGIQTVSPMRRAFRGRGKKSDKGHNNNDASSVPERLLRQTRANRAKGGEIDTDSRYARAEPGTVDREDGKQEKEGGGRESERR